MRLETPPALFMNGAVIPWAEGKVHVWSETAVRATNVFEGLRAYCVEGRPVWNVVAWDAHLERLQHSAKLLRIPHSFDKPYFDLGLNELLNVLPYRQDIYVRITIYIDYGPFAYLSTEVEPGAYIVAFPIDGSPSEPRKLRCLVSSWQRLDDQSGAPRAKSGALYHNIRLPRIEASSRGFDDAIMLNNRGKVSELTGACIFVVRNGVLATPAVTDGILEGITRKWIIAEARRMGLVVEERPVDRTELYVAEEVFSGGTLSEICAITQVDDITVGNGLLGPLTSVLATSYAARSRRGEPGDLFLTVNQARYEMRECP